MAPPPHPPEHPKPARRSSLTTEERLRGLEMNQDLTTAQVAQTADKMQQLEHRLNDMEKQLSSDAIAKALQKAINQVMVDARQRAATNLFSWLWSVAWAFIARGLVVVMIFLFVGKVAGWATALQIWELLTKADTKP